ncbi:hypothetical protein R1sor_001682 [Riccia sorocarpa]|uniref:Uncharacterized protein n=1 Tax=Riccia sorocarpa TaxID=122646 RepID=A0ABD3GZT5_9MARC
MIEDVSSFSCGAQPGLGEREGDGSINSCSLGVGFGLAVTVKALETTLRSDLAALGIDSFECPFDPQKIVCLRRKVAKDEDFVRLRFFHPEGRAQIVGVGLPFSEVVLWEHRNLESRTPGVCDTVSPRQWIGSLVNLFRLSGRYPSRTKQKDTGVRRGGMQKGVERKESNMRSGPSAESEEVASSSTSLPEPELSITVFFRSSRKELRVPAASDHGVQKPTSSSWSCWRPPIADEVDNTSGENRTYPMEARAVIKFSSLWKPAGTCVKSFTSTLQVDFNMPEVPQTSAENRENFGWYQDHLGVSFRCTQDGAVRKETKGIHQEVLSKRWVCRNQRTRDMEETVSTVVGKSGNAGAGVSTPAKVGLSLGLKKEKTTTKGKKSQTSGEMMQRILEEGNFRIRYCGISSSKLAYGFTHFPPSESFNLWDVPEDREALRCDVMTSNIPIEVTGIWDIVEGAETVGNGVCQYEFSCARSLRRRQQVTVPSKSLMSQKPEVVVEDYCVPQRMKKELYVNHSFSHLLTRNWPIGRHLLKFPVQFMLFYLYILKSCRVLCTVIVSHLLHGSSTA